MDPLAGAELREAIAARRAYAERLLERLIHEPSSTGDRTRIHELVEEELVSLGLRVRRVTPSLRALRRHAEYSPPTRVPDPLPINVLASTKGSGAPLVLFAHVDTEPVTDGWDTPPLTAVRKQRRLYGLGAADDKGGLVSLVAGVAAARAVLGKGPDGIRVLAVHAKQGGALGSLPAVLALDCGAGALYVHPAETGRGLRDLKTASRGLLSFRVTVLGRTPPPSEMRTPASADARKGVSAVEKAAVVMRALRAWSETAPAGTILSMNRVAGGRDALEVPARCELEGTVWFTNGSVAETFASMRKGLADRVSSDAWLRSRPPEISLIGLRANPASNPPRTWPVRAARSAIKDVTGRAPRNYGGHSASDIRFPLLCHNAPSVGFGAIAGNFYGPNEWVDLESVHDTSLVVARLVFAWSRIAAR